MRRLAFVCLVFVAAALLVAPEASAAKKKAKAATPAPAKQAAPSVVIPDSNPARRSLRSGKLMPFQPTRPDTGLTTIAPYPPPLDTSRDAAQRGRILNVPKSGTTTIAPLPPPVAPTPLGSSRMGANDALPKWGDYVYVTELPEAIVRVPPGYPDSARSKGIQGTVMVKALVLKDGTVGEVHASEPLPWLDAAAEACVRQWRFKPAKSDGTPVAVWVSIPVKFSLH